MTDGSGLSSSASLAHYDPDTSSWRTFQAYLPLMTDERSEKFSGTWPRAGMMRNGMLFPRSRLVPHSFVTDSLLWPTPRANKTTEEDPEVWSERQERGEVATPPLGLAVKMGGLGYWRTPQVSDAKNPSTLEERKDGGHSVGLNDQVRAADELFPTPTATPYGSQQGGGSSGREGSTRRPSLEQSAREGLWPTPTSRDWKDTPGMDTEGPDGRNRVDMLARAVYNPEKRFPTPRGSEGGVGMCGGEGSRQQLESLESQGHISSEEKSSMQSGSGGRLNPDWVEWLMGLPIGWTALKPLETPSFPPSHSGLEGES